MDVTNFDTSAVKNFSRMFEYCYKLKFLDLSSFDTSSVTDMTKMFFDSMNLNLLILSKQFIMKTNYDQFITNECTEIIENGASITNEIKDYLKTCSNVIEILIDSKEEENIKFINYFPAINNNNNNDISIYVNGKEEETNIIKANKDENYIIKIKYPPNFSSNCDGMFKGLNKIKSIKFYNFKGCSSAFQMFQNCSSLETLNLSQFNTSEITNMNQMFANSTLLNSIGVSKFELSENVKTDEMFCNCRSLKNIDKSSFTKNEFKCLIYYIKDLNIFVDKCENSEFKFTIEETKSCVNSCENTDFPFTILYNKTCTKLCPKNLFSFNLKCYLKCPEDTHRNEEKNFCECNNLFHFDEEKKINCLKKYCNETDDYLYLIKNKNQCVKNCSYDNNYKFSFNNECYFQCPKNTKNSNKNECECLYKFYNKSNELICLNENENCDENHKFTKEGSNECFEKCPEKTFIFNNKCLLSCENEKESKGKNCSCKFKYYYNNSILNCLKEDENCPEKFSLFKHRK